MLNVNIGSDTRVMVSKVLKTINNDLNSSAQFNQLNSYYEELLTILRTEGAPQIDVLRDLGTKIRKVLLEITELT